MSALGFRTGWCVICNVILQAFFIREIAQQTRAEITNRVLVIHVPKPLTGTVENSLPTFELCMELTSLSFEGAAANK